MAETNQTQREEELARREALLAQREAQLEKDVVTANRGQLEDLNTRQLVIMIFFSLYLGYTSTGVDNIAHLSGLVIGFVLAIILYHRPARDRWADGGIKR